MDGKFQWSGKGFCGQDIQHQMHQYEYPAPGYPPIHMFWKYGGPQIGTMTATNRYAKMYTHPSLEFVVSQSIWFEGEVPFADVILPACTNFERWDISEFSNCSGYIPDNYIQVQPPRDLDADEVHRAARRVASPTTRSTRMFAKKLGIEGPFTEGKDELGWIEQYYNATDMPKYMTFEEFKKKGYFVVPDQPQPQQERGAALVCRGPRARTRPTGARVRNNQIAFKGLQTSTGKVEFISTSIKNFEKQGYVDEYRPAMHKYVPAWESWHSPLAKKYPLGMLSPHPRFSFHTMGDGKDSFMNDIKDHRVLMDGWYYWIIRLNSKDAAARGIKSGDLVRCFNDRGSVIRGRPGGRARAAGNRAHLRVLRRVQSAGQARPLGRSRRLHEHSYSRPLHVQVRLRHGAEHRSDRG